MKKKFLLIVLSFCSLASYTEESKSSFRNGASISPDNEDYDEERNSKGGKTLFQEVQERLNGVSLV